MFIDSRTARNIPTVAFCFVDNFPSGCDQTCTRFGFQRVGYQPLVSQRFCRSPRSGVELGSRAFCFIGTASRNLGGVSVIEKAGHGSAGGYDADDAFTVVYGDPGLPAFGRQMMPVILSYELASFVEVDRLQFQAGTRFQTRHLLSGIGSKVKSRSIRRPFTSTSSSSRRPKYPHSLSKPIT